MTVSVLRLFLTVLWVGLHYMIVGFSCHTHSRFKVVLLLRVQCLLLLSSFVSCLAIASNTVLCVLLVLKSSCLGRESWLLHFYGNQTVVWL